MNAKVFDFTAKCTSTGEVLKFSGVAPTLSDAFALGVANLLFEFSALNTQTGETCVFHSQGKNFVDAFSNGIKDCTSAFRPSSDGKKRPECGCGVILKDGTTTVATVKQFESDGGVAGSKAPAPAVQADEMEFA